jgi:hypothetical protein
MHDPRNVVLAFLLTTIGMVVSGLRRKLMWMWLIAIGGS